MQNQPMLISINISEEKNNKILNWIMWRLLDFQFEIDMKMELWKINIEKSTRLLSISHRRRLYSTFMYIHIACVCVCGHSSLCKYRVSRQLLFNTVPLASSLNNWCQSSQGIVMFPRAFLPDICFQYTGRMIDVQLQSVFFFFAQVLNAYWEWKY